MDQRRRYEQNRESFDIAREDDYPDALRLVTVHTFDEQSDREDILGERDIEKMARHEFDGPFKPGTGGDVQTFTHTTRRMND